MRRFILVTTLLIVTSLTWSATNQPFTFSPVKKPQVALGLGDEGWILLGETTLSNCNNSSETIMVKLHAREIANKLVYRVEYQGEYYATRWYEESKTYHVTIYGKTYRCDVPTSPNDGETDNEKSAQFVGKWGVPGSNAWLVEITYDGGSYHFKINTSNDYTRSVLSDNSNEVIYTYERKIDESSELRRKGLRCFYGERDNNADPGYPTSGRYEYDREIIQYTEFISLKDSGPLLKGIKMHCFYYLKGTLTYAETSTDFSTHDFPITLKRH